MKIRHFIIHYIQKDKFRDPELHAKEKEPVFLDGRKLTHQGELISKFVGSAATMFDKQKSGKVYADINRDENTFAEVLDAYLSKKTTFIDFSRRIAVELCNTMKGAPLATGGYMAIAEYESSPRKLLIIMIRQEEGYAVDPDTLELRQSVHLDLSTINVGARLDLEAYSAEGERPLALVRGLKEVAKYFRNFLGVTDFKSPEDETREFAQVLSEYFHQNRENYDNDRISEIRRDVANLIRDQQGGQTSLLTLSGLVNPQDPQEFFEYANSHNISAEFSGDSSAIKGWFRVRYKDRRLLLDFDKGLLNESIHWQPDQNELKLDVNAFPSLKDKLEAADQ